MNLICNDKKTKIILSKTDADIDADKVVVAAVVFNIDDEVLLLKRAKNEFLEGLIELPSGSTYNEETLLSALIREVAEETGLDIIKVKQYINSFNYLSSTGKKTKQLSFLVNTTSNKVKLNKSEHSIYYWLKVGSPIYNSLNISSETKKVIDIAFIAKKGTKYDI